MTANNHGDARVRTGVRNLDELFFGGVPKGSAIVVAGPPGSGKTILTQQICFTNASAETPVLYFGTLSEPTAKSLRYLQRFDFFDPAKLDDGGVRFIDLGGVLRGSGREAATKLILEHVKRLRPAIVVIDSFRVFGELAGTHEAVRRLGYELVVQLMAWETTTFLLGEFGTQDIATNPLFSIVDGLLLLSQREESNEQQRFLQLIKLRGTNHSRDEHSFVITSRGVEVFAPRVTLPREDRGAGVDRLRTGISKLDDLLGEGIPRGSSLLVAGVAGTGKTALLLEFLYRGALAGEKGIAFSFEETEERLRASARGLGWDLDREIERGMIEIVFIPQPSIMVEAHLLMMQERVKAMQAKRVAIDSVSVFLHKVKDSQIAREKTFQLASIVQNAQAVGFFATDIPYGANQISRFGVEETVVDGVILLSLTEEGLERQRYLEIYKLRNTAHAKGRHNMEIGEGGITVFPRYAAEGEDRDPPPPLEASHRLGTGVPGLDELCGGGLIERSVTLVSGSAGIGKTTLGMQFVFEGAKQQEPSLYIALEEGPDQVLKTAEGLGLSMQGPVDAGLLEVIYLSRQHVRTSQLLAILDDKIRTQKTRRLVLDSVNRLSMEGTPCGELQRQLYALIMRFKARGVTSVLTLESGSLYATDTITEHAYSPVADNILMLRYVKEAGEVRPTLSVVKTRGSAHDWGTHYITIAQGGVRVGERVRGADMPSVGSAPRAK